MTQPTPLQVPKHEDEESTAYEIYAVKTLAGEILASIAEVISDLLALVADSSEDIRSVALALVHRVVDSLRPDLFDEITSRGVELGISHSGLSTADSVHVPRPTSKDVSALLKPLK